MKFIVTLTVHYMGGPAPQEITLPPADQADIEAICAAFEAVGYKVVTEEVEVVS